MSISVLLIVAINLFTFQQCMCVRNNLDDDGELTLKSQLVDTNCNGEQECLQFLGSETKHVECIEKECHCKDANNKTTACLPKVSHFYEFLTVFTLFLDQSIHVTYFLLIK